MLLKRHAQGRIKERGVKVKVCVQKGKNDCSTAEESLGQ